MGLLFILLLGGTLFAQEAPVFKAGVNSVRLDVQVGQGTRLIGDLSESDFRILDEGQPQTIQYFAHEEEPLDLLLLLDVSGSMYRYLAQVAATARQALAQLHAQDRVGIMLFGIRTERRLDLTDDRGLTESTLRDLTSERSLSGGTKINSAILEAARYLGRQEPAQRRRAVLMLTDNLGLNYKMPEQQVIQELLGADTVLNALVVGRGTRPKPVKPGEYVNPDFTPSDVFLIAEQTGGEAIKAQHAGNSFAEMIEGIRSRYSLQYHAPEAPPGLFRHVQVELTPAARKRYPHAWVRARSGYYTGGTT